MFETYRRVTERSNLKQAQHRPDLENRQKNNFPSYNGSFYDQGDSVAMGSPLASVTANLCMELFEQQAVRPATKKPALWNRYIDDIFVVWAHDKEELQAFLQHGLVRIFNVK